MKPVLDGRRVRLRPIGPADAAAIYASLDEPEARRLTGTHATFTLADVEAHCARVAAAEDRWDYAIVRDGAAIGEAVLLDADAPNRTIGFRIALWDPATRGQGFGHEAAALLVDFAFRSLGFNRVELDVFAFNERARRLYERLGFVHEGTRREALIWDGERVDCHIMALLARDYLGQA